MVFPGLSGGSDKGYVKCLVRDFMAEGFEVAVFNNRGVSETEYTSPEFYNFVRQEEPHMALEFIKS